MSADNSLSDKSFNIGPSKKEIEAQTQQQIIDKLVRTYIEIPINEPQRREDFLNDLKNLSQDIQQGFRLGLFEIDNLQSPGRSRIL